LNFEFRFLNCQMEPRYLGCYEPFAARSAGSATSNKKTAAA
jgi:hypothetical protein